MYKKTLSGIVALLLTTSFSSCLLTDAAGIQPYESIPGSELKVMIGDAAAFGWFQGCESYLQSSFSSSCLDLNGGTDVQGDTYPTFFTAYLMVKTFTEGNVDIDDGAFYKKESAEACAANAFNQAFLWTNVYLTNEEVTGNNVIFTPASAYVPSTLLAANLAAGCDFDRTGRIVDLGPLSL